PTRLVAKTFSDAICAAGYEPPRVIEPGRVTRFSTNGKSGDKAGWCRLFPDGDGGAFGDWRTGEFYLWQANGDRNHDPAQIAAWRRQVKETKTEIDAIKRTRAAARDRAAKLWATARPATEDHAYLLRKNVKPHGARLDGDRLVLPLWDVSGNLHSLQFINADGGKKF